MTPHLGHAHLKVHDLEAATRFYRDVFELTVTERVGRYVFLTFEDHHHDIALQEVSAGPGGTRPGVGLYHIAFELDDGAALADLYDRLRDREVEATPVDHGISKALYFDDPSGNGLEAYVDTREQPTEEWAGVNKPFDPTTIRDDTPIDPST